VLIGVLALVPNCYLVEAGNQVRAERNRGSYGSIEWVLTILRGKEKTFVFTLHLLTTPVFLLYSAIWCYKRGWVMEKSTTIS